MKQYKGKMTEQTETAIYRGSAVGQYLPPNFARLIKSMDWGSDVKQLPGIDESEQKETESGTINYLSKRTHQWRIGDCTVTQTTAYSLTWRNELCINSTEIKVSGPQGELERIIAALRELNLGLE
ncbi:hypothetical protein HYY74_00895 [Candidatus Woesearchaeota archaeon]|nr:hypothetical protein [Candidatus Woesearchaeota archaeon]